MMNNLLSNVSVGVIYDLNGSRSGDIVYLSWAEGEKVVRGELFGVRSGGVRDCMEAGLPEDTLELVVYNVYKVDKLLKSGN